MSAQISVSVVIPARNAESTLKRALDSVMAQTSPAVDTIVVDDASTDHTAAIARSYSDRQVTVLVMPEGRGAAAARNAGIRAATADWVAFLDADDAWLPTKLEKQSAVINSDPEVSLVFCASDEFSADGRPLGDTFGDWPVKCGGEAWKALLATNFVATPTVIAPRALLLRLGGFDESLKVGEDQDMWIRLALAGRIAYVAESLVQIHICHKSLSTWTLADQFAYTLPMIERHLARLGGCITQAEALHIMGERFYKVGRIACGHGNLRQGMLVILRSARLGYRPLRSVGLLGKVLFSAFLQRFKLWPRRNKTVA